MNRFKLLKLKRTWSWCAGRCAGQTPAVRADGYVQQQLSAIHQALHQSFGFSQRGAALQVHGVYLLEELLPVGASDKRP